jgi:ribosomal protein S18 acetylase RimI-like enzyme
MGVTIRAATVDDARAIAEIHVAGWRFAYRGQMPDTLLDALSVDEREARWRQSIETPRTPEVRTWVAAAADGRVAGFAMSGPERAKEPAAGVAEIYAIYVDPARLGSGMGRALMEMAVGDLRTRGFVDVVLWVLDTNERARRFYEAAGMAADGGTKRASFGGVELTEVRYRSAANGDRAS